MNRAILLLLGLHSCLCLASEGEACAQKDSCQATVVLPGPGEIMGVLGQEGLLAQQEMLEAICARLESAGVGGPTRDLAASTLANVYSFEGDYLEAARVFPVGLSLLDNAGMPLPRVGEFVVSDAVESVVRLSRERRLVIINEAHHLPETRWLPMLLLPELKALGYGYLALEALSEDGVALSRRGYADKWSGSFTNEPIYAETIRLAISLGYRLVRYDLAPGAGQAAREAAQAKALATILKREPGARMLVFAGYRHASKNDEGDRGGMLATRLQRMGLAPLTVDQTALLSGPLSGLAEEFRVERPSVLAGPDGVAWSAAPRHYDLTVLLPASGARQGRPVWLALGGRRRELPIQAEICGDRLPCLVEARHSTDGRDAVPADRFVLRERGQRASLYLAPGRYRISAIDAANRPVGVGKTVDVE